MKAMSAQNHLRLITSSLLTFLAALAVGPLQGQAPGKVEVRAIKGAATYSTGGQTMPLKVGTVVAPGSSLRTTAASSVDLFLGKSAGLVRLLENSRLDIDKFTLTDTGRE